MKVEELLKSKKELTDKIKEANLAIEVLEGKIRHHHYRRTEVHTDSNAAFAFDICPDIMVCAITQQVLIFELELGPITDKLNAIELMLNS